MPHAPTDDGVRLYYEESGSGTPLVFVHEYAGDYRSWEPQMRYFSRHYRCIAFNARGIRPPTCRRIRRNTRRRGRATTSAPYSIS
jgi:pimeloyl-ACP methyl ester carboxylesterase